MDDLRRVAAFLVGAFGLFWGAIGLGNIVGMDWSSGNTGVQTFGLIFNGVLFLVPAAILVALAVAIIPRKSSAVSTQPAPSSPVERIEDRLLELDRLLAAGKITAEEREAARAQVLGGIGRPPG